MSQVNINENITNKKRLTASNRFVFEGYEFLPEKQQLLYQGKPCLLEPKMLQLINLLIQARPHVVSKEKLLTELWPDSVVAESSLSRLVSDTRKLMENNGKHQKLIKTVRGRGFCFCAPVDEIIAPYPFQHEDRRKKVITSPESISLNRDASTSLKTVKKTPLKFYSWITFASFLLYLVYQLALGNFSSEQNTTKKINHDELSHKVEVMQKIQKYLKLTKTTYLAQKRRRLELKQLLVTKLPEPENLTEEKRMRLHHADLSADERFIFDQIKAMTQGPMHEGNQAMYLLLEQHPEMIQEIPLFDALYSHLSLWLNKYQRVFSQYDDMAVVFVGDEDGVPFPSAIDSLVSLWLTTNQYK